MNTTADELAVLDVTHLAKYTLGDAKLEREILHMFVDQSELYLSRLKTPESTKDWFEAAHSLKGCARGIGAFKVGMRAAQLEKIAEPLQSSVRSAILVLLQSDLGAAKTAILAHLEDETTAVFL